MLVIEQCNRTVKRTVNIIMPVSVDRTHRVCTVVSRLMQLAVFCLKTDV